MFKKKLKKLIKNVKGKLLAIIRKRVAQQKE